MGNNTNTILAVLTCVVIFFLISASSPITVQTSTLLLNCERFVAAAKTAKTFNTSLGRDFRRENNDYIGNMNHIHVNMAYVSTLFTKLSTSEDKSTYINVYDFLTKIMDGIGKALGGVNDFEVVYDSDDNFFYIIDNTALPGAGDISESIDEEPVEFLINLN